MGVGEGTVDDSPSMATRRTSISSTVPTLVRKKTHRSVRPDGETAYKNHRSSDIILNIKLGVRHTIAAESAQAIQDIQPSDYEELKKYTFPSAGSASTPAHTSSNFKFKDYCPKVFRHLRKAFDIDTSDYMLSFRGEDDNPLSETGTEGKSGALFYATHDGKYLIKTVSKEETRTLLNILGEYFAHVHEHQSRHLLPHYFQLIRITTQSNRRIRMLVMRNILPAGVLMYRRYDLKGSTFGRITPQDQREKATLKDLDFLEIGPPLLLGQTQRQLLFQQMQIDCNFLMGKSLMDYSLLVGMHVVDEKGAGDEDGQFNSDEPMSARSSEGTRMKIFFGIIDILQAYNAKKKAEHRWKAFRYDSHTVSSVPPPNYAGRFQAFMGHTVFPIDAPAVKDVANDSDKAPGDAS